MSYQSAPIKIDGIEIVIKADSDGVDFGKTVDGIYASDLVLTPEQAMELADALTAAATFLLANKGG